MKRIFSFFAIIIAFALLGFANRGNDPHPISNVQFEGTVKYTNGNPAPFGTIVKVFLNGSLRGQKTLDGTDGHYAIRGNDENFPTGSYRLEADDQIGTFGEVNNVSHTQATITEQDIVLNNAY